MNIYAPYSYEELEYRIRNAASNEELCAIRYPRSGEDYTADIDFKDDFTLVGGGKDKAVITFGKTFSYALKAQKEYAEFDIIKLNKIFPLSESLISIIIKYKEVHVFEEGIRAGGIGEHISALLLENKAKCAFKIHAIDGAFVPQQTVPEALSQFGLDTRAILLAMENADEQ